MKTTLNTTVAIVRHITGLSAQDFARRIGKTLPTVKSLESGRLKLSDKTAQAISKATGVSMSWLLSGDTSVPPVDQSSKPWDKNTFERALARAMGKTDDLNSELERWHKAVLAKIMAQRFEGVLANQFPPTEEFMIIIARTDMFLTELEKEFGTTSDSAKIEKLREAFSLTPPDEEIAVSTVGASDTNRAA